MKIKSTETLADKSHRIFLLRKGEDLRDYLQNNILRIDSRYIYTIKEFRPTY